MRVPIRVLYWVETTMVFIFKSIFMRVIGFAGHLQGYNFKLNICYDENNYIIFF
jgi:hypothetical protein